MPNRFFNLSAVFFWLAVHTIYAHLQFRAFVGGKREQGWLVGWYEQGAWFLPYILVTIALYTLTKIIENSQLNLWPRILSHATVMACLLISYWLFATTIFFLIKGRDFNHFFRK